MTACALCSDAGLDPYCRACLRTGATARRAARLDDSVLFLRTRWAATDTTFGPWVKVPATVAIVVVTLSLAWLPELLWPLRFVSVPTGAILCGIVLRSLWRPGSLPLPALTRTGDVPHDDGPAGHGQGERRYGAPVARETVRTHE